MRKHNESHAYALISALSVRPYDDSEYNQPYCTKNEGKYIYKTKLQTQKKILAISQIDIE